MAGKGPQHKPNATKVSTVGQVSTRKVRAPARTGKTPPLNGSHHRETVEWYRTWRNSPQATQFEDTDWLRLQMLAILVDTLHDPDYPLEKKATLMAEIRQNESKLGATIADRNSMYMTITRDDPSAVVSEAENPAISSSAPVQAAPQRLRVVAADPVDPAAANG